MKIERFSIEECEGKKGFYSLKAYYEDGSSKIKSIGSKEFISKQLKMNVEIK